MSYEVKKPSLAEWIMPFDLLNILSDYICTNWERDITRLDGLTLVLLVNAENYYKNCISLPMYPSLTDIEQSFVINQVMIFVNKKNWNKIKNRII